MGKDGHVRIAKVQLGKEFMTARSVMNEPGDNRDEDEYFQKLLDSLAVTPKAPLIIGIIVLLIYHVISTWGRMSRRQLC